MSDYPAATEVEHEVTVRTQLRRTSGEPARSWEQTGVSWAYCLCGWAAATNGEPLATDIVETRAAQHLREAVTATMDDLISGRRP